jgi:hypothetical protein
MQAMPNVDAVVMAVEPGAAMLPQQPRRPGKVRQWRKSKIAGRQIAQKTLGAGFGKDQVFVVVVDLGQGPNQITNISPRSCHRRWQTACVDTYAHVKNSSSRSRK